MNPGGDPPPRRAKGVAGKGKRKKKLEAEDVAEDNPALAAFLRQRRKAEARMADTGELDFYLCVVFQSEKQKNEALENLPEAVSVLYNMYVDGEELWKALGIKGVTPNEQGPLQSPLNKRLIARTGIPDQGTDQTANTYWGDFG